MAEYALVFSAMPELSDPTEIGPGWVDSHNPSAHDEEPKDLTWFDSKEEAEDLDDEEPHPKANRILKREDGEIEVVE